MKNKILFDYKFFDYFFYTLLGAFSFFYVTRGTILSPLNESWLLSGDGATFLIGWKFFLHSPLIQWPIGSNPNFGLEISNSIVYSDSIPLMAFIFKPLKLFLPETFQYFGLWILFCFILQSIFSSKLLSLITKDRVLILIGTIFFITSNPFLWRLQGHYALMGHWLIIAGIYYYFLKDYSPHKWLLLLILASLVHAYLLVMLLLIWTSKIVSSVFSSKISKSFLFSKFITTNLIILVVMWASGYFMFSSSAYHHDCIYGFYKMNVLSIINPDNYSMFLERINVPEGDYEGFNYLGIGMLVLGMHSFLVSLVNLPSKIDFKFIPIVIISILFIIFAISNNVDFGAQRLFSYEVPTFIGYFANTFRSSGRFFWPVYYLIYLYIFYIIFNYTNFNKNIIYILCICTLFFQLYENKFLRIYTQKGNFQQQWVSPIKSDVWVNFSRKYSNIIYVLPRSIPSNWEVLPADKNQIKGVDQVSLAAFAAKNNMSISLGYFSRFDPEAFAIYGNKIKLSILQNKYASNSLYVFENDDLWNYAIKNNHSKDDFIGTIDGYRIVAPKFSKF